MCLLQFQCRFIQFSKNKATAYFYFFATLRRKRSDRSTYLKYFIRKNEPSKLNSKSVIIASFKTKHSEIILRKEVIQPHLPIRLPCYDFTPIIYPTFGGWLQKVTSPTSGVTNSRGVTGGVYKARERIHRGMLIRDY